MNKREVEILKKILKDNVTIEVDVNGVVTLLFCGEVICKSTEITP